MLRRPPGSCVIIGLWVLIGLTAEKLNKIYLFSALGHAVKSLMAIVVSKQVEGLHKASGLELHKPQGAQAGGL